MISCVFENGRKASLRHVTVNALIIKDNQLLLEKRAESLSGGGKWGLVGGFADRDEILIDAIKREIYEETGYRTRNLQFFAIVDNPNRIGEDRQNICFVYVCELGEKEGESDLESTAREWFDLDNLPKEEEFAFDHLEIIKFYLKNRDKEFPIPLFKSISGTV